MFRLLFTITIVFILWGSPVFSETVLTGGITYTISFARKISFRNISYKVKMESFYKYKKFKKKFGSKYIKTVFSDNTFCITPKNSMYTYYYSENGNLIYIENQINEDKFIRYARYDINGNLDSVVLDVGNNEQFVFDVNKKLVAHWIGKNGYDENGELFGTRD